jgi:DNA-binding PadR family transcriptional regulator
MIRLTSRDMGIIRSTAACEVMTMLQLHQWHFDGLSVAATYKRLGKLAAAGYLKVVETKVGRDNLYTIGKEGGEALKKNGWKWEIKKEIPKDLEHHKGVVDARIGIEKWMERMPEMKLRYFYAYWELGQFQWPYAIIPDAVFSIRNAYMAQGALEFDRNQYSVAVFAKKLLQYGLLVKAHPISTVIVVAEQASHVEKLGKALEDVGTRIPLLTVALQDLRQHGLKAIPYRQAHMPGERSIIEQIEIDAARIAHQSE